MKLIFTTIAFAIAFAGLVAAQPKTLLTRDLPELAGKEATNAHH